MVPSREHFSRKILPCSSTTFRLPARWWSPSTFCVINAKSGVRRSSSASATWPALGCAAATFSRRHAYQSQTRFGLRANAVGVASSRGSKRAHKPVCESRNVASPDSAEMPAPVSAATHRALRSAPIKSGSKRIGGGAGTPAPGAGYHSRIVPEAALRAC
jgi:hypothetical protein